MNSGACSSVARQDATLTKHIFFQFRIIIIIHRWKCNFYNLIDFSEVHCNAAFEAFHLLAADLVHLDLFFVVGGPPCAN